MFPQSRPRRLRRTPQIRRMVRETQLHVADLVFPMFVVAGQGVRQLQPSPVAAIPCGAPVASIRPARHPATRRLAGQAEQFPGPFLRLRALTAAQQLEDIGVQQPLPRGGPVGLLVVAVEHLAAQAGHQFG